MIARSDSFPSLRTPHPVMRVTPVDRVVACLSALLTCLLLTALALFTLWQIGGTPAGLRSFVSDPSLRTLELLPGDPGGTGTPLVVTSPQDDTSDPSVEPAVNGSAAFSALLEQLEGTTPTLVKGPPGTGPRDRRGPTEIAEEFNPQRWVFRIQRIAGLDDYTRMLRDTGIEPGAFDLQNRFIYLSAVGAAPKIRRATATRDNRFYTRWESGTLVGMDEQLFRRAGVQLRDRAVVHFFSPDLETRLAELERAATRAAGRRTTEIRRTWFTVVERAGRYDFEVVRQTFRDYQR